MAKKINTQTNTNNTQMADKMKEAGITNLDINNLDVSKLDMSSLLALMEKVKGESQKRDEEIKKEFQEFSISEVSKLQDRIQKKYPGLYINIEVSFEEKKPESHESNTQGEKVPFKWFNPNNPQDKWTGRGMSPKWVSAILEKEGISLETFKKDERFIIKTESQE